MVHGLFFPHLLLLMLVLLLTLLNVYIVSHYVCIIIFRLRICIEYNPIFEIIWLILRSLCSTLKSLCAKIGINCVENHHSNELKLAKKNTMKISIVDMWTECTFLYLYVHICVHKYVYSMECYESTTKCCYNFYAIFICVVTTQIGLTNT